MNKSKQNTGQYDEVNITHHLDITPETCPMTFVRTKLMIEKMHSGDIAEVRLKGAEPLDNVPKSVTDMGHDVLSLVAEDESQGDQGIHRLMIRKN